MAIFSVDESGNGTTNGTGAVEIQYDMKPRFQYRLTARNAPLWFSVVKPSGTAATAGGSTSHWLPAGGSVLVAAIGPDGSTFARTRISFLRDGGTDAQAILSQINQVQAY